MPPPPELQFHNLLLQFPPFRRNNRRQVAHQQGATGGRGEIFYRIQNLSRRGFALVAVLARQVFGTEENHVQTLAVPSHRTLQRQQRLRHLVEIEKNRVRVQPERAAVKLQRRGERLGDKRGGDDNLIFPTGHGVSIHFTCERRQRARRIEQREQFRIRRQREFLSASAFFAGVVGNGPFNLRHGVEAENDFRRQVQTKPVMHRGGNGHFADGIPRGATGGGRFAGQKVT